MEIELLEEIIFHLIIIQSVLIFGVAYFFVTHFLGQYRKSDKRKKNGKVTSHWD